MAEGDAQALREKGNEHMKAGRPVEAAEAYTSAIEVEPGTVALWGNRSAARLKAGDAAGALADADEAVRLDPGWVKGYLRRARALEDMGKLLEAAEAATIGSKLQGISKAEAAELRRLEQELLARRAGACLVGTWHGTVSATLGGYAQEFSFKDGGVLECIVYGEPKPGKYQFEELKPTATGGLCGGLNVELGEMKVPYLFKLGDGDGGLHLCCPMTRPERPLTFDGPGYVSMAPGRPGTAQESISELSEGRRLIRYLEELTDALEYQAEQVEKRGSMDPDALEELEEQCASGEAPILGSGQLATETLDDKRGRMQSTLKLEALKVKYGATGALAERIIKGEAKVDAYSDEEQQTLHRLLRSFKAAHEAGAAEAQATKPAAEEAKES